MLNYRNFCGTPKWIKVLIPGLLTGHFPNTSPPKNKISVGIENKKMPKIPRNKRCPLLSRSISLRDNSALPHCCALPPLSLSLRDNHTINSISHAYLSYRNSYNQFNGFSIPIDFLTATNTLHNSKHFLTRSII